jgi:hypothetical protein
MGKFPEEVSPVTYMFKDGSRAMLVPMSVPDPPKILVELVPLVPVPLVLFPVVNIRATNASVPPPELPGRGVVFGKLPELVQPVTRAY